MRGRVGERAPGRTRLTFRRAEFRRRALMLDMARRSLTTIDVRAPMRCQRKVPLLPALPFDDDYAVIGDKFDLKAARRECYHYRWTRAVIEGEAQGTFSMAGSLRYGRTA